MGVVRRTISPHAAPLRSNATDAERALWGQLRGRRLAGYEFRRQWTLDPYIADFCCVEHRLIVEADGGQHTPVEVAALRDSRKEEDPHPNHGSPLRLLPGEAARQSIPRAGEGA